MMKKIVCLCSLLALLLASSPAAHAQLPGRMDVPYGNFESWDSIPADTATLMGFPIPLYDGFSLPTGWAVPTLSINETLSYMGTDIPLQFSLPVAKVLRDSLNAPQGLSGLAVETFQTTDLLTPMASAIASSILDTTFTQMVLPTIAATAEIHLENIIPLIDGITSNLGRLDWLLEMVDTVDISQYFSGGFPLNGLQPQQLKGYYLYHNASPNDAPDNGAVVAFGTRYDTMTHTRKLVGAGSKRLFQLYDTVNYEPFVMDYFSLSDYYPSSYHYYDADTMVVLVISSASDKSVTAGSILYVDSLWLTEVDGACGRVYDLRVTDTNLTNATIAWNNTVVPDRWEVEYGRRGFVQGRGTVVTVSDSTYTIEDLQPATNYDCYVRALCGDTANTSWVYATFTTDTIPSQIAELQAEHITIRPCPAHGRCQADFSGMNVTAMRLYTVDGRIVESRPIANDQAEIVLPTKGLYILELQTPKGLVRKRIVSE